MSGGHTGVVQNLNVRTTVLLTLDGNQVQIPNAIVYKSIIKNYSSIPSRRAEFAVGIGYESSAAKAQVLIAAVLQEHPAVLDTPEPLVLVEELGPATVNLRIYYWFDSATYSPYKINSAFAAPDQKRSAQRRHRTAGFRTRDHFPPRAFPSFR